MRYDILIENGRVIDGAGNPWFRADVGVVGDRVVAVGRLGDAEAERRIDARGLTVAPGFIDIHSHSDYTVLIDPRAESKVRQGVTTEVVGNCGSSAAPMSPEVKAYRERYMRAQLGEEFEFNWETMGDYLDLIDGRGASFNVAALVGHGTVRQNVMGWENRAPTRDELDEMKALVAQTMEEGAFGLSTGLMYTPGNYAETDEVIELAKVVARYGGIHTSHDRRRGWESDPRGGRDFIVTTIDSELWSIQEVIKIGEEAGIPTTWSHAKACGEVNWCRSLEWWFREIEFARRRGVDVGIDVYPWTFRGGLVRGFPTWAQEGGPEKMRERLKDPETRRKIRDYVKEQMESVVAEHTWDRALILTASEEDRDLIGKFMTEAAEIRGMEPVDLYLDRLEKDEPLGGIGQAMHEEDVQALLKHPLSMVGTDGSAIPADPAKRAHPRNFGTFPKILRKYVREERVLTLEEAIRKMTSAGATKLGLMDRGLLRPGFWADVTVFDPLNVRELATYEDPVRLPRGIEYVFVNGVLTIEHDRHTGARAGKPLKHRSAMD
ncbi:MAG: amidohydrolase family protein [Candidatus Bathyarchaeia archaeon]